MILATLLFFCVVWLVMFLVWQLIRHPLATIKYILIIGTPGWILIALILLTAK